MLSATPLSVRSSDRYCLVAVSGWCYFILPAFPDSRPLPPEPTRGAPSSSSLSVSPPPLANRHSSLSLSEDNNQHPLSARALLELSHKVADLGPGKWELVARRLLKGKFYFFVHAVFFKIES